MIKFLKKAFKDMKESAKAQHEVDKANFEENRGANTFRKAKENAKKSWDDAHMSPVERTAKLREEQQKQIEETNKRKEAAEAKYQEVKVSKK